MSDVALEAVHVVIVEEAVDDAYHADTSRTKPRSLRIEIFPSAVWTAAYDGGTPRRRRSKYDCCKHVLQVIPRDRAEAPPDRAILFYCGKVGYGRGR